MTRTARQGARTPPEPTEASLHDAALRYVSRYAATQAGLQRVLDRRIARWAATQDGQADDRREAVRTAGQAARRVVAALAASGAVDDAAFARARATSLRRAGKSTRAIGAHLSAKGVPAALTAEAGGGRDDAEDGELGAAAVHLRRRRLGAFRTADETAQTHIQELASFARAGFAHGVAGQALLLSREEAEALIIRFRAAL